MKKLEIFKDGVSGKNLSEKIEKITDLTYKIPTLRRGRVIYDRNGINYQDLTGKWHFVSVRYVKPSKNLAFLED